MLHTVDFNSFSYSLEKKQKTAYHLFIERNDLMYLEKSNYNGFAKQYKELFKIDDDTSKKYRGYITFIIGKMKVDEKFKPIIVDVYFIYNNGNISIINNNLIFTWIPTDCKVLDKTENNLYARDFRESDDNFETEKYGKLRDGKKDNWLNFNKLLNQHKGSLKDFIIEKFNSFKNIITERILSDNTIIFSDKEYNNLLLHDFDNCDTISKYIPKITFESENIDLYYNFWNASKCLFFEINFVCCNVKYKIYLDYFYNKKEKSINRTDKYNNSYIYPSASGILKTDDNKYIPQELSNGFIWRVFENYVLYLYIKKYGIDKLDMEKSFGDIIRENLGSIGYCGKGKVCFKKSRNRIYSKELE